MTNLENTLAMWLFLLQSITSRAWCQLAMLAWVSAGHAALLIAIVNRLHGRALPQTLLRLSRLLHDVLIVAFPLAVWWWVSQQGGNWTSGYEWQRLPGWALAYLWLCAVVTALLPAVALKRWLTREPEAVLTHQARKIDVARQLGYPPRGPGPSHWMTWIPGNEIWQLEILEKQIRLPRLPPSWDGLRVVQLSDLHFLGPIDRPYFEYVVQCARELQPDLVVFSGDLLDRQKLLHWLPTTLGTLQCPLGCYYVLGNHDAHLTEVDITRQTLRELGWTDVAETCITLEYRDSLLQIGGTEVPWMGTHPEWEPTDPVPFRLLISHTPDNLHWARQQSVDLMLAGHNHGGQVRLPGFGPVYSPSIYGCKHASGTYWVEPTLLHVSRGISGQHPLRLWCPPELTLLVLWS